VTVPPGTDARAAPGSLGALVTDPEFWAGDPHPTLRRLRREAPVCWAPDPGLWVLSRHRDVVAVSRDPAAFCSSRGVLPMDVGRELPEIPGALLYVDPPEHGRYRRLINPSFATGAIRRLERAIRARAGALLAAVPAGEPVDVVGALAVPYPLQVIADLLGIPADEWPRYAAWTDHMIAAASGVTPETAQVLAEMSECFLGLVAARRDGDGGDLVSVLAQARLGGAPLGDGELMMFFGQLLVAGNETTRNLVSGGLLALAEHPDQWARLQADGALVPRAVEELLRWTSPVISFMRTATRPSTVGGIEVAAGDRLLLLYPSANRDETVFGPDSEQLDVGRHPNPHVAFGYGEHVCLGAALARLEARVLLEEVLARFRRIEPAGTPERLASEVIAGIRRAPLRFVA
jgi:cytochrome P450